MWGKTLAFVVVFILVFGTIIAWIPTTFQAPGLEGQDPLALSAISAANLILYTNSGSDNMTYQYSSLTDHPNAPQFNASGIPDGEYLEVWWGVSGIPDVGTIGKAIELRHSKDWFWWFQMIDNLEIKDSEGNLCPFRFFILKETLEDNWDESSNSSRFYGKCAHISTSIIFKPTEDDQTIGEAWDNNELYYALSFDWSADETGFNIMALLADILLFQGINLGVPGILGSFFNTLISVLMYIAIAVVAYVIITAIIPFISGAPDT